MLFHEWYSAYYHAVSMILREAANGEVSEERMREIVSECAFPESHLAILPAIKQRKWPLFDADGRSLLKHRPHRPMTLTEKRFLRSVLDDPRAVLFERKAEGLEDVEPLFDPSDVVIYDRCRDGDPYWNDRYVQHFTIIREAIRDGAALKLEAEDRRGHLSTKIVMPKKLEYSEKDDKFRLYTTGCRHGQVINLGRIHHCQRYTGRAMAEPERALGNPEMHRVILSVVDERSALSRATHHFAHFAKEIEQIGAGRYRMTLQYDPCDESELVIRILTFGPMVKVEGPRRMAELVKERVVKQAKFGL